LIIENSSSKGTSPVIRYQLQLFVSSTWLDHRFIKKSINPMLGFKSFETAKKTIQGIEIMHMIKKGQVKLKKLSALNNVQLFNQLFGLMT
jgi:transposase-like protein